jgi:hypothetical protein
MNNGSFYAVREPSITWCFSEFKYSVVRQVQLKSSRQNHTLLNFQSYSNLFLGSFFMQFDIFILFFSIYSSVKTSLQFANKDH